MILCIGTTPAAQRVMVFARFTLDAVNRATKTLDGAAGKSINVAKVLRALGEDPYAVGFLGGDRGDFISSILVDLNIKSGFVRVGQRTRECITIIEESAARQTELVQEAAPITSAEFEDLQRVIRQAIPEAAALVLSGTLAPGVPPEFYRDCVQLAREHSALCVVDAQGTALAHSLEAKPDLVKPNRAELAATLDRELTDQQSVLQAMVDLCSRGSRMVVVTHGREPTLAYDGRRAWRISAPRIAAVNPIGSGDAFTAALTARLVRNEDLGEACRWGTAAGAANALSWMAGEVVISDVESLLPSVRVEVL
jgi:tagatose 6-phosphate kinase